MPETVGSFSISRGARVALSSTATGQVQVIGTSAANTLARANFGTLVFTTGGANRLGNAPGANSERFVLSGGSPPVVNGMVGAYVVDETDKTFVTYGANGFTPAAFTSTQTANFATGIIAGTDIVNVTANTTLADNPKIFALATNSNISNGAGQVDTITLSGTGATSTTMGGLIFSAASTVQPNIKAGSAGQFELPVDVLAGNTANLNGDITATGITKFGTGTLSINKDQSSAARGAGYTSGWVVNEGTLTLGAFGSLGDAVSSNTVTLNGSASGASILTLAVNSGSTTNATYTSGRIIAVDNAQINYDPGADDRTQTIGDVQVQSTGGTLLDAQLNFNYTTARNRTLLDTGVLSLIDAPGAVDTNGGAIINVAWGANLTAATSSGVSVAALSGTDRLRKWGAGTLYVRGNSSISNVGSDGTNYAAYTGNISIEQGAIQIENVNALGTGTVTVNRYGVLDINAVGYTGGGTAVGAQSVTYLPGAIERWSANGARSRAGTLNLGATDLQIANDQTTGSATIQLSGGTIEGFLYRDSNVANLSNTGQGAVYRTVGSGYSFQLTGNSFLGQNIAAGVNGDDSGATPNVFSPSSNALSGVILEIRGQIFGGGSLTKQGFDAVVLSNANNTYSGGTFVNQGWLRAGATNTLPTAGLLSTTGGGVFDLNGFNTEVGTLTSPGTLVATTAQASGNGYITNTAPYVNTLTVGNGTAADFTYAGLVQYNVGLTKIGGNILTLLNTNTYAGPTTINAGDVRAQDGVGLSAASNLVINDTDPNNPAVFESSSALFTRALGTGAGQVQLPGGVSGFGAFGTPVAVDLGGNGTGTGGTLSWGSATFNPSILVVNDSHATASLTLKNAVDLNTTVTPLTRQIAVNSSGANTATIAGNIVQSGAGAATLDKIGSGTLALASTSTLSYTGGTTIDNGTLRLGKPNQLPQTLLTVNSTATPIWACARHRMASPRPSATSRAPAPTPWSPAPAVLPLSPPATAPIKSIQAKSRTAVGQPVW